MYYVCHVKPLSEQELDSSRSTLATHGRAYDSFRSKSSKSAVLQMP